MPTNQTQPIPPKITPPTLPGATTATATTTAATANGTTAKTGATGAAAKNDTYDIPEAVKQKYPDIIELVLSTKSMNEKEKQYWFHILPAMKDQQVEKLRKILINEKQKLAEIDKKYSQKLQTAQEARVSEWKGEAFKEKLVSIKQAEKTAEDQEKQKEEELLNQLNSL